MSLAGRLARSNLMYRRPDIYDHFADGDDGLAALVRQVVTDKPVGSVLDLGCGTGRHLAAVRQAFGCAAVGVDVQPGLIDYGQAAHPELELLVGDIRSIRLDQQFDVVLCLGNSLSYQLTDADTRAAAETFGAHTRPGGHVLVGTMLKPPLGGGRSALDDEFVAAEVESQSSWDADTRVVTTRRIWRHRDGRVDEDVMRRRVTPLDELTGLLGEAGFTDVALAGRDEGFVVARKV
ncbi:class I SAM-dependent methyltransferase [Kribbella antibiotica]|uniref:Class I SAM-dependent methyltransferase n=1 Tax=Kribbella antibiotica TaxID=190195 RepID=A0A4R4ZFS9_9ACTN|nr:class I SAM-dependent methyltransferase [Kribbella antibiotica]TDD56896.1 class I SAM-dependent methyltransferase [Kribbella antibiotica]